MVDISQNLFVLRLNKYFAQNFMKDFLKILRSYLIEINEIFVSDDSIQSRSQLVKDLFTNERHLNLTIIFVCQNLFYTGKKCGAISLNSTYIVVFRNPRDQT